MSKFQAGLRNEITHSSEVQLSTKLFNTSSSSPTSIAAVTTLLDVCLDIRRNFRNLQFLTATISRRIDWNYLRCFLYILSEKSYKQHTILWFLG